MSNKQFTLDIEPSSSESTMDEDTEDEKSINQIVKLPQSQENVVNVSDFIIPTQHCTIVPPTPTITKITIVIDDLQDIAIKIKRRRIETRFFSTIEECGTDSLKDY